LEKEPNTLERINEARKIMQELSCLQSFKVRRDKFYAHSDKQYFLDRERLAEEAPLTWGDLQKVTDLISEIFNRYSAAYDGQLFVLSRIISMILTICLIVSTNVCKK
jgi:AbiU2